MRNFLRIAMGIDTGPLVIALARKPELWNAYGVRTWHPESVHGQGRVDDVVLRYNKFDAEHDDYVEAVCSVCECEDYPPWEQLPEAQALLWALMARVGGQQLGRVFISRLRPGMAIPPHSDRIGPAEAAFPMRVPPAEFYDRYHIILASSPGVVFRCGDDQVQMQAGEAWWFQNAVEHEVVNNSADDRISLVADIHSHQHCYTPPIAKPTNLLIPLVIKTGGQDDLSK